MPASPEEKDGLLHHEHQGPLENPYEPDATSLPATEEVVERAAGESHHGIIRERDKEKLGREEEAKLALENTEIKNGTAWVMTVLFLLTIFIPPIVQTTIEVRRNLAERRSSRDPNTQVAPQILDVLQELPPTEKIKSVQSFQDAVSLVPDAERIKSHETALEDNSIFVNWMLPRAQYYLAKWGGVGNEQAYVGRDGWLFYRPDVDYLTSPGFLDPSLQRVRARAGDASTEAVQPDPVRAIADFQQQLSTRGIKLIIMPMPVKPMFQAHDMNAQRKSTFLQNPSYDFFLKRLEEKQITVFDPTEVLRSRQERTELDLFLKTDTHWTPGTMDAVARELSGMIESQRALSKTKQKYFRKPNVIDNLGDTATMLNLLPEQSLYPKQRVEIQQVFDGSSQPWQRDKRAEVLLLGDSFFNIYSLAGMGWGSGAGFAEQLSFHLQRPVDSIVVNAGGSHTSRQQLLGEMHRAKRRGEDRLKHVKLVVWEFSMRDLLIGDWKLFQLP